MVAHCDKHCCPTNATLSKMPRSLTLHSARRDILPVCSEIKLETGQQHCSSIINAASVSWRARLMSVSVAAATDSILETGYLHPPHVTFSCRRRACVICVYTPEGMDARSRDD